jgi:class 3 adenylate cyclase
VNRDTVLVRPETRYARSGDVNVAYQVTGEGPFDLIWVPGFISNVELAWAQPTLAAFNRGLASFSRLIRFDKRGTGMSDRVGVATLETRMDDVRAVLDAVGSPRAALLGSSEGGPLSLLFAASYPERTLALVLWSAFARVAWAPDYPWGESSRELEDEIRETLTNWNDRESMVKMVEAWGPGHDRQSQVALAAGLRQSASPGDVEALLRMGHEIDVRNVLSSITAPTLVLNREGEGNFAFESSRYLAEHIPGARHLEFAGIDHMIAAGDTEPVLQEIERFLTAAWESGERPEPDRVLTTVLFSDIVGSSERASSLGDQAWREVLQRHNELVRRRLVSFRGKEMDTAGDGFFASFDGPARAIRCGSAIADAVHELGLEVRVGLHTGECELIDGKVAGIAVHTGARVASNAQPGEVLVSSTVKDLVAGSGITFQDRGLHELKGIPGEWHLYAVAR